LARLEPPTSQADAPTLRYQEEDGSEVEPVHFVPLLPLILLNGAAGIGTGWSTNVWSYHPVQVLDAAAAVLRGEAPPTLEPWVRGFTGGFECINETSFESVGRARLTEGGLEVTELPLGTWTQDYKAWLLQQQKLDDPPWRSFSERHTERHVHFFIHANATQLEALREKEDLTRALQLRKRHLLTNMHAFDHQGRLLRLASPGEAISRFVPVSRLRLAWASPLWTGLRGS
jgi:DNA topoisomerase-2